MIYGLGKLSWCLGIHTEDSYTWDFRIGRNLFDREILGRLPSRISWTYFKGVKLMTKLFRIWIQGVASLLIYLLPLD